MKVDEYMFLVGNGIVITNNMNNEFISNGCVVIDGNIIKEVGETDNIKNKYKDMEFIDVNGKIIMPGIINMHHHIYSAFARGLNINRVRNETFTDILKNIWWKIDKKLTLEDIKYSAYTTLIESIKNGVTTIFDHHASPMAIEGSLLEISNVANILGVRWCYCYEVSDRDGERILNEGIKENVSFIKYAKNKKDDMTKGIFGMHASFTLNQDSIISCVEAMEGVDAGYHIHVAEGIDDLYHSLNISGKRVVERLMDYGILGKKTLAIHCVHINEREIDILKHTNTNVINAPESNMNNAVGCAPVIKMIKKDMLVGIGTDGYTNDVFESIKVENIVNKNNLCDSNIGFLETKKMFFNNSTIASKYFNKEVGVLKENAYADIIIVDYNPMTPINKENYFSHILFGISGGVVDTTIINGQIVMKNRKILNIDEKLIYEKSREVAKKLWKRI